MKKSRKNLLVIIATTGLTIVALAWGYLQLSSIKRGEPRDGTTTNLVIRLGHSGIAPREPSDAQITDWGVLGFVASLFDVPTACEVCAGNLAAIERAKEQCAIENDARWGVDGSFLPKEELGLYYCGMTHEPSFPPKCPLGGEYVANPVGVNAFCTRHGDLQSQSSTPLNTPATRVPKILSDLRDFCIQPDTFHIDSNGLCSVSLSSVNSTSLDSFRKLGLPLNYLVLRSPVYDLRPLQGMPLEHLELQGTLVTDLSPLTNTPLRSLSLDQTRITDLTPLSGMNLCSVSICGVGYYGERITNGLSVLRNMDSLEDLRLGTGYSTRWYSDCGGFTNNMAAFRRQYDAGEFGECPASGSCVTNFTGIGAYMATIDNSLEVLSIYTNSPAQAAGLQRGDTIIKIDGEDITGMPDADVHDKMGGAENTTVTLDFVRHNLTATNRVTIVRRKITAPRPKTFEFEEERFQTGIPMWDDQNIPQPLPSPRARSPERRTEP